MTRSHSSRCFSLVTFLLIISGIPLIAEVVDPFHGDFATDVAVQRPRFIGAIAQGEDQTVVTYGTSLTAGGGWQTLLETQLNRRYAGRVSFINCGISASCSADGIPLWNTNGKNALHEDRLSEMLSHPANTYFVEFGVNDAIPAYRISIDQSKANHEKLFDRIEAASAAQGKKPDIVLLRLSEPILESREQVWKQGADACHAAYPELAAARGYLYFDATPSAMKLLDASPETYKRLYPDGLHFNHKGAALIASILLRAWGEKPLDDDLAY